MMAVLRKEPGLHRMSNNGPTLHVDVGTRAKPRRLRARAASVLVALGFVAGFIRCLMVQGMEMAYLQRAASGVQAQLQGMELAYLQAMTSGVQAQKGTTADLTRAADAQPGPILSPENAKMYNSSLQDGLFAPEVLEEIGKVRLNYTDPAGGLLFMGIFVSAADGAVREMIRKTTALTAPTGVTIRFVVCHESSQPPDPVLWSEMRLHRDIVLLDEKENLTDGKAYSYFRHVSDFFPGYNYYGKTDADSYINYLWLALQLNEAPRQRYYFGRRNHYIGGLAYQSGSLYILSKDLVGLLKTKEAKCREVGVGGYEDVVIGQLVRAVVTDDTPEDPKVHMADLGRDHSHLYDRDPRDSSFHDTLVLVHPLKTPEEFWQVHCRYTDDLLSSREKVLQSFGKTYVVQTAYVEMNDRDPYAW